MPRPANILLMTWDGAGNLPPERSLVRALIARGHTVRVLAHASIRELVEKDGAEYLPVNGARHYDSKDPMTAEEEIPYILDNIWFARPFGSELLAAVEKYRPDLLLVDISLINALVAARCSGLPTAVLCHYPYHVHTGPFCAVLDTRIHETNAYAAELGIASVESHQELAESLPLVLVVTYRPFEPLESVAPNVIHVGPVRPPYEGQTRQRTSERPFVLVSLSTSNQNQTPLLQRICDALGSLDIDALVTTGPAVAPDLLRVSRNTTVRSFVSHDEVLPATDLLITHAGHGTVMAGATYGTPMLCFPMGRDQPMIADRAAQLGLAAVAGSDASAAEIRQAIAAILADRDLRTRARQFAESLAGHPGLDHAVELVENLLPH